MLTNKQDIVSKIAEYFHRMDRIIFAYVFGSFARGEDFSDIDIGIYLTTNSIETPLEFEFAMENRVQEKVGYAVDVRILNRAPVFFAFQVIRDGVLVKDSNPDMRSDFECLIFKKVNDLTRFRDEYLREIVSAPV